LLAEIDVPESATVAEVRVFKLKNALAQEIEEVLGTILRADQAQQQGQFGQQQFQAAAPVQAGATGATVTQPRSSPRATTGRGKQGTAQVGNPYRRDRRRGCPR
jgi:hypothetical protein